jgi:hypothetical protein
MVASEVGMLSDENVRVLITAALLAHALAHAVALGALIRQGRKYAPPPRVPMRYWLYPSLAPRRTAIIALPFWTVATVGFVLAALSFWGSPIPAPAWRTLAVVSSGVSLCGIALFSGIWPGSPSRPRSTFNALIALAMNAAVLVSLAVLHWPAHSMFNR